VNLGSCQNRTLDEVLAGKRATSVLAGFRRNELVEDLCRRCTFITRFDGKVQVRGDKHGAVPAPT